MPSDDALDGALQASKDAGLPAIQVTATEGKLIHLLARMIGARRVLEIGTFGGYRTIWLARALPPKGRLITLESEPIHAKVAGENLARAGLQAAVEVRLGPALETLPLLAAETVEPFDLIFLDADKPDTVLYFEWALKLSRPGTLIIADNVVRNEEVADPQSNDPSVQRSRQFIDFLATEKRVSATAIQTVGSNGYDGFVIALVNTSIVNLRPFLPSDLEQVMRVYHDAIHTLAAPFYTPEELCAWAPQHMDADRWRQRLATVQTIVAESGGIIAGFLTYDFTGHIDMLFTLPQFARQGLATRLFLNAEVELLKAAISTVFTEASLAARPFFERQGFQVDAEEYSECRGHKLRRFRMSKKVSSR